MVDIWRHLQGCSSGLLLFCTVLSLRPQEELVFGSTTVQDTPNEQF